MGEIGVLPGVDWQRDARGHFAHSKVITVRNAEGEILLPQVGVGKEPVETIAALAATMQAKGPAVRSRVDPDIGIAPAGSAAQTVRQPSVRRTLAHRAWSPVCTVSTWSGDSTAL